MIELKEKEGQRKLFVAEPFVLEKCGGVKPDYLRKARCVSELSWRYIKERGLIWYEYDTIPNRAPHYVLDSLGSQDELVRIARFGDPAKVSQRAKEKLLAAYEAEKNLQDLAWYQYECPELQEVRAEDKRDIRQLVEEYFEAYTWLKLIKRFFNNGWIQLGLHSKREMMGLIVELLAERKIKGLKITNADALQRKINWYNEYKSDKRKFVIHKNIQNKHRQVVTEDMVELFKSIFSGLEGGKLNFEDAWMRYNQFVAGDRNYINTDTGEVYDPVKFDKVSKSTIKLYLHKYESRVGIFANRSGDWNKLSAQFIPSQEFEMPKYANSLLSIDDLQPPFVMRGNKRIWFYAGVDLASECWFTWVYGRDKNLAFIKQFYRQMIINFHKWGVGMPKEIEMESHLNSELEKTLLLPGVLTERATIYRNRPNPKKVERYIGMIRNEKARLHPNFVARPFTKAEWLSKGSSDHKEMEYEEIAKLYVGYMEAHNSEPHSKSPNMTRLEYYRRNQNPECSSIAYPKLLPYLGYHTYATIKAGKVKVKGESYLLGNAQGIATGEELKKYAAQINDGRVSIYYLHDEDLNYIAGGIYTEDDRYICSLYPMPKYQKAHAERTEEDKEKQILVTRYQQTFIANLKDRKSSVQLIEEYVLYENAQHDDELEVIEIIEDREDEIGEVLPINADRTSTWSRF